MSYNAASSAASKKIGPLRLFLLVSLVIIPGIVGQPYAEDLLAEGKSLFEAQRYDLAQEKLTVYLNAHPGDPVAMFYLGRIESDGAKSQEYFQRIVDESPQHELADDALAEIAEYYYARGYYITAQRYYRQLLQDYPQSNQAGRAQFRIGQTYMAVKKPGPAREALEKLVNEYPTSEWVIYANAALVHAYILEKDWENAISLAEELTPQEAYHPVKGYLLKDIAEGYTQLGRKKEAEIALQRILVECPTSYEASRLPAHIRPPKAIAVPVDTTGHFVVQAGAFSDSSNATRLQDTLIAKGFSAFLNSKLVDEHMFWRVWVGPYRTRSEAEQVASLIPLPDGSSAQVAEIEK